MSPFVSTAKYRSTTGQPFMYEDPYGQGSVSLIDDPSSNMFILTAKNKQNPEGNMSFNVEYSQAEQTFNQYIDLFDMLSQQNYNAYLGK